MIDTKQRRDLVTALLACPSISDRHKRDTIINDLPASIRNNIQRNSADKYDVTNLVNACLNYKDGLKELIEALEFYEGRHSVPYQKVKEILARIAPPGLLSDEKLGDLLTTIPKANIPENELRQFYLDSLPSGFPPQPQAKTLWSILRHLQDIPRQPDEGTVAILIFVECVALQTNTPEIAATLRNWSDQIAPSLGADIETIRKQAAAKLQPQPPAAQTTDIPPSLLVEIRPDATNRRADKTGLFNVKILLWQPGEDLPLNLYNADSPGQLSDIPAVIDRVLVDEVSQLVDDIANLVFQFFLPLPLISCDVDQWLKQDMFMNEIKLGEDHPVLVRSLERSQNPGLQAGWRKRWEQFQKISDHQAVVHLCPKKQYGPKELLNELKKAEKIVCLGVTFLLSNQPDERRILSEVLGAGIPVALWPRASNKMTSDIGEIKHKIKEIIWRDDLSCLPQVVREARLDAAGSETHLGNHLTLLWDDPDRIPPKQHLQYTQ